MNKVISKQNKPSIFKAIFLHNLQASGACYLFLSWNYVCNFRNSIEWLEKPSLINRRAFGLMTKMKNIEGENRNYAIGGVNLQKNQYIQEVEMYDESYSVWKFYKYK